jgi:hypothetical protein
MLQDNLQVRIGKLVSKNEAVWRSCIEVYRTAEARLTSVLTDGFTVSYADAHLVTRNN